MIDLRPVIEQFVANLVPRIKSAFNSTSARYAFAQAAGDEHLRLILEGMDNHGADPQTGKFGVWRKLSPRRARELGTNRSSLKDTGALRSSIGVLVFGQGWKIRTTNPYAHLHNEGGIGEEGQDIPKRAFLIRPPVWTRRITHVGIRPAARVALQLMNSGAV